MNSLTPQCVFECILSRGIKLKEYHRKKNESDKNKLEGNLNIHCASISNHAAMSGFMETCINGVISHKITNIGNKYFFSKKEIDQNKNLSFYLNENIQMEYNDNISFTFEDSHFQEYFGNPLYHLKTLQNEDEVNRNAHRNEYHSDIKVGIEKLIEDTDIFFDKFPSLKMSRQNNENVFQNDNDEQPRSSSSEDFREKVKNNEKSNQHDKSENERKKNSKSSKTTEGHQMNNFSSRTNDISLEENGTKFSGRGDYNKPWERCNNFNPSHLLVATQGYESKDRLSLDYHLNENVNSFQTARELLDKSVGISEREEEKINPRESENYSTFRYVKNPYEHNSFQKKEEQISLEPSIPAGLKRKFKPPTLQQNSKNQKKEKKRNLASTLHKCASKHNNSQKGSQGNDDNEEELPEELQHLEKELVQKIEHEILDQGESVKFEDIAGLCDAKQTVQELVCWPMKRPDLFTGLRRGPNGLLLFGPPGTGKTLIGKAIAHESGATFFSISSSSLTSKWIGEGEKLVRTLFAVANYRAPAVVFIDEIDSLLTQRKADENEASRRIKTEFLVQLDGTSSNKSSKESDAAPAIPKMVLVIGATNRPHELDDAARRRFVKRIYIPLPEQSDRESLLRTLLKKNSHNMEDKDFLKLSLETNGFSGADLKALCTDAALGPIRQLGEHALDVKTNEIPPIRYKHFRQALKRMNPSVAQSDLEIYTDWNSKYGSRQTGGAMDNSDDEDSTTSK